MLNAIFIIFIAISTVLTIIATDQQQRFLLYIFKPLTISLILMLALLQSGSVSDAYKAFIIVGLCFSMGGDIALMLPDDRFVEGLASFFMAHIFYVLAFSTTGDHSNRAVALVPLVLAGVGVLAIVWNELGRLKAPVLAYVTVIILMTWLAVTRWLGTDGETLKEKAFLAAFGAVLFMTSDAFLAVNRFRFPFRLARPIVLSTYFAAQTLIALSI